MAFKRAVMALTMAQAAEKLGLQPGTLRAAARLGTLVATRHGREWVVTVAALAAYDRASRGRPGRPGRSKKKLIGGCAITGDVAKAALSDEYGWEDE